MAKINIEYNDNEVVVSVRSNDQVIPKKQWLQTGINPGMYNVITDLTVNELVTPENEHYVLSYENLPHIDRQDLDDLTLAPTYPYDLFITFSGSSFLGADTQFSYSFQDYAGENGTGNILADKNQRRGAFVDVLGGFLLSDTQFKLLSFLDEANRLSAPKREDRMKRAATIQKLAEAANAVVSRTMLDRIVKLVDSVKIDIRQTGPDQFKLMPIIADDDHDAFTEVIERSLRAKESYRHRENGKTTEFAVTGETEEGVKLSDELGKLMRSYTRNEVDAIFKNPSAIFDTDLLNLDLFGKRVIELGIYQPRYQAFISPYQSEWIPGINVDDPVDGTRRIAIKDDETLAEFDEAIRDAKTKDKPNVHFHSELIPLHEAQELFAVAKEQLRNTREPIVDQEQDSQSIDPSPKVLIIKENIEKLGYSEEISETINPQRPLEPVVGLHPSITLKFHQSEGIKWLQNMLRNNGNVPGVLLADDMGLGKTLQVLYFIEWFATMSTKPILVVAPVSLLENWEAEYQKFFPSPVYTVYRVWGNQAKRFIVPNEYKTTKTLLSSPAIYLTTYETMRHKQLYFAGVDWGLIVMDEVQKIKTPGTMVTNSAKALKADFRIAMTGTPVENSLIDLWCIMDFCYPGLLRDATSFSKKYVSPQRHVDTDQVELGERLRQEIGDKLMRRLKPDVAKDLPSITHHRCPAKMPNEQFSRYVNVVNKAIRERDDGEGKQGSFEVLFAIKRISDHPYCKIMDLSRIPVNRLIQTSAKLSTTVDILRKINSFQEKAILFTENREVQRMLQRVVFDLFKYRAAIVNGTTPSSTSKQSKKLSRQDHINAYQAEPGFGVIIMSPIAAGFGLNVTGANHVIHYTRHWNPAKEQQATDRAYRIGQEKPVHVYYPLAIAPDNSFRSFDLVLDDLLHRKKELAEATLFPSDQTEVRQKDMFHDTTNISITDREELGVSSIEDILSLSDRYQLGAVAYLLERQFGGQVNVLNSRQRGGDMVWQRADSVAICQYVVANRSAIPVGANSFKNMGTVEPLRVAIHTDPLGNQDFFDEAIPLHDLISALDTSTLSIDLIETKLALSGSNGSIP